MNTPAHIIFGTAAFGRPTRPAITAAAMAGGLAPDLSLYVMVSVSIWWLEVPPATVFREYYYSDAWQAVFAVDNSFIIWGALCGIAVWRKSAALAAFAGAALLHLAFDFPLHNHDARRHFWPLTDWVFVSPVSYWDNAHHAGVVEPLELLASLALAAFCLGRLRQLWVRGMVVLLAAAELSASNLWRVLF